MSIPALVPASGVALPAHSKAPLRVLVVGATSAIGRETARLYAARGSALFLLGRDETRLRMTADDLRVRGAVQVTFGAADFRRLDAHPDLIKQALAALERLDVIILCHGILGDHVAAQRDVAHTLDILTTNFLSTASFLTLLANHLEMQGAGCLAVVSSVAGDRGRQSNYVYGASKAGLDAFLSGLRNRLFRRGVCVVTIKPGLVDTPMTAHLPKSFLFASPTTIARGIVRAVESRKDIVYLPWFWRYIMLVIRLLPEFVFKRLSL